ncbi:NUDIX hydrolase [Lysinibacter cavernae]|uniref:NUDIX hydrolase n=1 Tax=Lysinibacter cavernae TaxID=1640652 RepID=UPI00361242D6
MNAGPSVAGADSAADSDPSVAGLVPSVTGSDLSNIEVAAIALIRERRVLMVTARGRDVIFMPGGKVDAGETLVQAAARESREEVGLELDATQLTQLFTVLTQAHGEPEGRMVNMVIFAADTSAEPVASAEVSELHWATTADLFRCPPAGAEVVKRLNALGLID